MKSLQKRIAIYPGSFDPVTFGHIDIIRTAAKMFDKVYVAIANNTGKKPLFNSQERLAFMKQATKSISGVKVEMFNGLIVNFARKKSARAMIRGIRAVSDFDYEFQMALANQKLEGEIHTVFVMPSEDHFYISSRLIKEIAQFGGDVSRFVPPFVESKLRKKLS
ncbi:MAG: pantetheine-phosphate adenylyltransferase [Candidatus Omnitrophica bacterium]|nr:pantetheine-phosphate adenylyltransferase [Candidatus Omnitrophota bacterium]